MSQAIEKAQATELGTLVARREELSSLVGNLKVKLRQTRVSRPEPREKLEEALGYLQQELEQYVTAVAERDRLAALTDNQLVRVMLQVNEGVDRQWYQAQHIDSSLEETQRRIERLEDTLAGHIQDPRVQIANALADAESELESVRTQIKEARAK